MRDRLAELGRWESTLAAGGLQFGAAFEGGVLLAIARRARVLAES